MLQKLKELGSWLVTVWTDSADPAVQTYRGHVRGLTVGWAATAIAMALVEGFPAQAQLSTYQLLGTAGLPWQLHWLAAIQLAGPLLMVWHVNGLRVWGRIRATRR